MSTQENHYFMYGSKFGYDEFYKLVAGEDEDKIGQWIENVEDEYRDSAFDGIGHKDGITIVSDGMRGQCVYVGWVIQKSGDYGKLEDHVRDAFLNKKEVKEKIEELVGNEVHCQFMAFTHNR